MENKVNKIKELLEEIESSMKEINIPDKIIEKEITEFGNSAHVVVPREHLKKKAIIIIKK